MARYTILRFMVFFGCMAVLWLAGLRDRQDQPWLVVGAALLSMVISFFVLRPFREDAVRSIEARQAAKAERRAQPKPDRADSDEAVEDSVAREDEQYR